MVNIYLNRDYQSPFLSISNSDIERLSNRPFRWLRYVMFSICGAYGDFFHTSDTSDDPVDYDTSLANLPDVIYYKTSGECIFVDYQGLNDLITSSEQTRRRQNFRGAVLHRDGSCVITDENADECDAAHLIPWSRGDGYIRKVVLARSPLYDAPPSISGINDGQNGMLLIKGLHWRLGYGGVAFLKTPNYGLEPTDIKRVGVGTARTEHITLQQLKPLKSYNPSRLASLMRTVEWGPGDMYSAMIYGANIDAQFRGPPLLPPSRPSRPPTPPTLILDYAYGVAAYKCWGNRQGGGKVHAAMEEYHGTYYEYLPPPPPQSDDDADDTPIPEQSDESGNYRPSQDEDDAHGPDHWRPHMSLWRGDVMAAAMDELNSVLMSLQGITPQDAAIRWEKQMEEEELKAQEASRSKVIEWMRNMPADGS